jgi:hypothetical protein
MAAPTPDKAAPPEWQGAHSIQVEPLALIITDELAWISLWQRRVGPKTAPRVDFTKYFVVCVFLGEKRTGGYGVHFGQPFIRGRNLVIPYKEIAPAPDKFVTQALTYPFHCKAFERNPQYAPVLERVGK